MKHSRKQKRNIFKRTIAILLSVAMLSSNFGVPGIFEHGIFEPLTVNAYVDQGTLTGKFEINSLAELYEFSANYNSNNEYPRKDLWININGNIEISPTKVIDGTTYTWTPIGTSAKPFGGKITIFTTAGARLNIAVDSPFFGCVMDTVDIINANDSSIQGINLVRNSDSDSPLFANSVVHDTVSTSLPATWDLTTRGTGSYAGIIGTVGTGSDAPVVNLDLKLESTGSVSASGNAGIICGTTNNNSTINATFSTSAETAAVTSISSTNGSAGAFAGEMKPGASLNLVTNGAVNVSDSSRTVSGKTFAGGLVGKNDQGTVSIKSVAGGDDLAYNALGSVTASEGPAGGVFGYYKITETNNRFSPYYYTCNSADPVCAVGGTIAGAIVGQLVTDGTNVSYSGASSSEKISVISRLSSDRTTYGGIVGSFENTSSESSLSNSLTIEHVNITMSGSKATNYGGVVGVISGSNPVYAKINDVSVTSSGSVDGCTYFGGAVGDAGNAGSMIDVSDLTVATTSKNYKGGGVVGKLSSGVLRLSGTTNLSGANASSGGQIVGERTDGLVYALGSGNDADGTTYEGGWRLIRSYSDVEVDDIGTWGEVVRISGVETKDPEEGADTSNSILIYNSSAHTVTVGSAVTDMRNASDFTRTALNMQLNDGNKGALRFDSSSNRTDLLANTGLTVFGTINLSGTGITGFMRDGSTKSDNDNSEIKFFTGKLSKGDTGEGEDDEDAVINLAVGERYGVVIGENSTYTDVSDSNSTGRGAIFRHRFNGLFARTGEGTIIENISIGGTMNVRSKAADMNVGGAIAYLRNGATLTNVNVSETINYHDFSANNTSGQYVGGLVGRTNCDAGKNVTIGGTDEDTKATIAPSIIVTGNLRSNINNSDKTVVYQTIGGMIGYIGSTASATTTVEHITLSASIDASAPTGVANVSTAGLIADIAWNATDTRTLALNDIDVSGTVVKNKATTETGGILGYRWYGTDVTFDDVVLVADSGNEINSPAKYVGGLVYRATGHWKINTGGIDIDDIAFKNGDSTATPANGLGIILHDGYYSTSGIYMEFMAEDSYALESGLSNIPDMTASGKLYDELCVCLADSAEHILTNDTAGVISYYTSGGIYTSGEETKNSYDNVYNQTVVNNRSRYYYNSDIESYTNNSSDAGYKLLYWSLNRYAAANIKHCFANPFSTDVLTGTFDLKNISYYPIDISKNVTIGDATFVFYNSEIEVSEMSADTKRSTRDGKSQHYTMHMGLFRNVSATITTTGNIRMYGKVGVDSTYSGALINGTLTGTLNTASEKNIYLGYASETIPLEISDTNKYLFINKIGDKAVLSLNGLYIDGAAYDTSDDTTYASSLIGDVQGTGINLTFNNIKIDGRNKENITITKHKYGTDKSIFSNATLLNKYDVDSTSVAVYNFSQKEDWGSSTSTSMTSRSNGYSKVTFGRELTDSVEYKDEENRYYENGENGNYIAPVTYPGKYDSATAPLGTAYDFSSDYLPYVRYFTSDTTKITNPPAATYTLREIRVNVVPSDLTVGCGSYDHPYSITSAKQLAAVATMLDYTNSAETALIPNVMLPETNDGTHWCCSGSTGTGAEETNTNDCLLFTYNSTDKKYKYEFTSTSPDPETGEDVTTVDRTVYWEINDVRKYLASAYYQIGNSIELSSTFTGLGAYDSEYAFKGVIVGLNNNITVTQKNNVPLIKISNGSVVKDLKIVVDSSSSTFGASGNNSTIFNYSSNALVYGGVIGKIMGGDNIIDNVSMTYSNNGFIKTQNSHLMCVGGYVGVIVNGGLVFRNMTSSSFTNKSSFKVNKDGASTAANWVLDENNTTAHGHLFVNPYIGRVINGYAINETKTDATADTTAKYSGDPIALTDAQGNNVYKYYDASGTELTDVTDPENDDRIAESVQQFEYQYTLDNGTKNYQIADVKADIADSVKLYYDTKVSTNDRVNIPDGQALFMLSLITQSGAGTATTADGAYAYAIGYDGTNHYGHVSGVDTSAYNVATHLADYDEVGSIKFSQKNTGDYATAVKDKYNDSTAVPYIIYYYSKADTSGNYPARKMTGATDFMKLSTAGGTYNLPESFRGIGSICDGMAATSTTNPYQMQIYGFEGNGATINEQIIFKAYSNTNDNYANKVYGSNNINLGMGLFNVLIQKKHSDSSTYNLDEGYYIGNFTLTGQVTVKEYNTSGVEEKGGFSTNNGDQNNAVYRSRYAVGGVTAGLLPNGYANFYNLDLNSFNVTGTSFVGAYIGRNNITEVNAQNGTGSTKTYVNGCDTTSTRVVGSQGCSGGIMGGNISGYPSIYVNTAEIKAGDTHTKGDDGYYKSTMQMSITNNADCSQGGIGAVIGTVRNGYGVDLWVNNLIVEGYGTTGFSNNSTTVNATWTSGAGGLFGFVRKANSVIVTNCEIKNLSVKAPLAGGLFGNIDFYDSNSGYGTSPVVKIANCKIKSDNASTYSIEGIKGAGGITGQFTSSKAYDMTVTGYKGDTYSYDVDGCEVSGYTISQTGTGTDLSGAGGLFGYARATRSTQNTWSNKMRTIVNTSVHDCIIKADGSQATHGMGAVIGCVPTEGTDNNGADTIIETGSTTARNTKNYCGDVAAYNISVYNNAFSYNGSGTNAKCGNFVGQPNEQNFKIVGFMRKNNTKSGTAFSDDYGGDVSDDSYIIDADYMNISTTSSHGTSMAVGFDNGTPVSEGAAKNYFPYVSVSPKVGVGTPNFLTGDGVSIIEMEKTVEVDGEEATVTVNVPIAKLIAEENTGSAANNRIAYKTVSSDDVTLVNTLITYGEDTTADHDIKLTTYFTEMGRPEGYTGEDFPILAIGGEKSNNATGYNAEINAYIRLLTNTTDNYQTNVSGKFTVDIYPCQCINGIYKKVDGTAGFKLDSGSSKFIMDDEHADSIAGNNQISMIDISFLDPTAATKTAYHLYIPVLTKKMLKFDFSSSALQGTEYEPSDYTAKFPANWGDKSKLAAGFDSWQTIFVQYDYSKEELDTFLAAGKGLDWNSSKILYFNYTNKKSLANSTQFVLLDNNNGVDREYYITKTDIDTEQNSTENLYDIIKFGDFTTERNGTTAVSPAKKFTPQSLNNIAGTKVVYTANNSGAYVECSEAEATVYAYEAAGTTGSGQKFFKAYTTGATGQRYTITVTGTVSETYYLSMYSYRKDNVDSGDEGTTNDAYAFTLESALTLDNDVITCQRNRAKNTEVYIGDFISQTLTITDYNQTAKMSSDNHTLYATLNSTVAFTGRSATYFHRNLSGETLYQNFFLYLDRRDENGDPMTDSTIKGQPYYSYTRTVGGEQQGLAKTEKAETNAPYIYIDPVEITIPEYVAGTSWSSTQTAVVSVDFGTNESILVDEFQARTRATNDYRGVKLNATSKIDFLSERVLYSNNKKDVDEQPRITYYVDRSSTNGTLTLTALDQSANDEYDTFGEQSHNKSSQGINADYIETGTKYSEMGDYEHIDVALDYDISELPNEVLDGTHSLTLKFELEQKQNSNVAPGYTYVPVKIEDYGTENTGYLKNFKFYGKPDTAALTLSADTTGTLFYTYTMPMTTDPSSENWPIRFTEANGEKHLTGTISFDAKTNDELEKITGYMYSNYRIKVTASISDTAYSSYDWVVWTNAKINAQYVSPVTQEEGGD